MIFPLVTYEKSKGSPESQEFSKNQSSLQAPKLPRWAPHISGPGNAGRAWAQIPLGDLGAQGPHRGRPGIQGILGARGPLGEGWCMVVPWGQDGFDFRLLLGLILGVILDRCV